MKALVAVMAALVLGACSTVKAPPLIEVVRFTCPQDEPPGLYELPPRLESVRPLQYVAERVLLEGRHEAFEARYGAYLAARARCPKEEKK